MPMKKNKITRIVVYNSMPFIISLNIVVSNYCYTLDIMVDYNDEEDYIICGEWLLANILT